ncbi:hypothetical protein [Bradyrhizobium sp. USDA 4506]
MIVIKLSGFEIICKSHYLDDPRFRAVGHVSHTALFKTSSLEDLPDHEKEKGGPNSGGGREEAPPVSILCRTVEVGQRKVDVVELLAFAEAIGFDPREAIKYLLSVKPD